MRRLMYIAAFFLAVSVGSAFAQMRGSMGRAGGMGRSGGAIASRGFVGGAIGAHPGGLGRGSIAPRFFPRNSIQLRIGTFNPFFGSSFGFNSRFGFGHRRAFFRNGFFPNQFLFGGWPYYSYGWWGDPFYASSYYDASQQSDDYRQQQVDADLQALRNEVRTLREDNERARYENGQPPISSAPRVSSERPREVATDAPATVLVFRDGHKVETRNYAIVGQTLWLFNERRATKVPVSELDVAATTAADEQRGIDFHLPKK